MILLRIANANYTVQESNNPAVSDLEHGDAVQVLAVLITYMELLVRIWIVIVVGKVGTDNFYFYFLHFGTAACKCWGL